MSAENKNCVVEQDSTAECLLAICNAGMYKITIEKYCPALDKWILWREFEENTGIGFSCAVMDEELIVIGGIIAREPLNKVTSFNLNTMKCTPLNPTATSRHGACAIVLEGLLYYIGGGDDCNQYSDTVERWDPNTRTWSFVAPINERRYSCAVAVLNDRIYVVGGFNDTSLSIKTMEYYEPNCNKWTTCASKMNVARSSLGVAVLNNYLYAVGGYSAAHLNNVERYDPNTDSWTTLCSLPTFRQQVGCVALDGHLLVVGGYGHPDGICSGNYDNIVEEYDPEANTWAQKAPKPESGPCICVFAKNLSTNINDSHSPSLHDAMSNIEIK